MTDKRYEYKAEVEIVTKGEFDARDHDEVKRKVEEDLRQQGFEDIKIRYIKTTVIKEKVVDDDDDDLDLDLQYPFP